MEQLDKFVKNPFDGEVASLAIPTDVIEKAASLVQEIREDAAEINTLSTKLLDLDGRMKSTTSKFVNRQLKNS
jgi:hypothetical protein